MDEISSSTSGDGTINYRAPELLQIPPQRRSKASDVYALAGILYAVSIQKIALWPLRSNFLESQMHTIHDPYDNRVNKKTIFASIIEGPPARPKRKVVDPAIPISDGVWSLLLKCWNSNAEERPTVNKIIRVIEAGELS